MKISREFLGYHISGKFLHTSLIPGPFRTSLSKVGSLSFSNIDRLEGEAIFYNLPERNHKKFLYEASTYLHHTETKCCIWYAQRKFHESALSNIVKRKVTQILKRHEKDQNDFEL